MAVILKTEQDQVASITPLTPSSASVEAVEPSVSAPVAHAASTFMPSAPSIPSTRRYDQETIEKALALASAMQQEHQATLTAEQVVRLGEEMNVDQAFVLKALSRLNAEEQTVVEVKAEKRVRSSQPVSISFRALPRTDIVAAVIIPLAFSLLAYFLFRELMFDNWYTPLFIFVAAPLFAIFLGVRLRSKRLGFLSGAILGLLLTVSVWLTVDYPPGERDVLSVLGWTLAFTAVGAALGTISAIIALHGAQMYRRSVAALTRYFPGLAETDA